jgi:hypothetical protein
MKKLAAGNWKMNGTAAALAEVKALIGAHPSPSCEMLLCPPATLIAQMAWAAKDSALMVGGQDCHPKASGAHTGDISAAMLKDAGASHVIVGHSERRTDHGETDALVKTKAEAALAAGLVAIVCIGETEAERDAGKTLASSAASLTDRFPRAPRLPTPLSPMSRSGPSAPVARQRWTRSARCTPSCATAFNPSSGPRLPVCASFTVGRSSPRTRWKSLPFPTSTARWSAGPASRPLISARLWPPFRPDDIRGRWRQSHANDCRLRLPA